MKRKDEMRKIRKPLTSRPSEHGDREDFTLAKRILKNFKSGEVPGQADAEALARLKLEYGEAYPVSENRKKISTLLKQGSYADSKQQEKTSQEKMREKEVSDLLARLGSLIHAEPQLAEVVRRHSEFAAIFETASGKNKASMTHLNRALPKKAPALWSERDETAGETAIGFFQRVYAPWLEKLHLADISELDQPLYQSLQTWRRRHIPPQHLKAFFERQRRTRSEIDAELKKHKIEKPEDAFARFPKDRAKAQRLYQACRARLGLR
ncbi:MAG: hypothetical protein K8F62_05860 [Pseudorhodoplanes sp.]|nr:hypothetical protein [Pseudorhodoplanes sp.]